MSPSSSYGHTAPMTGWKLDAKKALIAAIDGSSVRYIRTVFYSDGVFRGAQLARRLACDALRWRNFGEWQVYSNAERRLMVAWLVATRQEALKARARARRRS